MFSIVDEVFIEALFASNLQRSDQPSTDAVNAAITEALGRYGSNGCSSRMASEFGDHPETAVLRMAWVRDAVRYASRPAAA
jgi:hypothetical protein